MPEQTESLSGDHRLPHEIAGIEDFPLERDEAVEAAAEPGDSALPTEEAGTTPGPDLSFLDRQDTRDTLSEILAGREDAQEIVEALKDGYERKAAFTRKTQALARERKELESLAEKGKYWMAVESDPALMDHILSFQKGGGPKNAEPELPQDIFEMTPQQLVETVAARIEQKYAPMQRELDQLKQQQAQAAAPVEHIQQLEHALVEWADDNSVPDDVMQDVGRTLTAEYDLSVFTPQAIKAILPRLVHSIRSERQLAAAKEKQEHESRRLGRARAASPVGNAGVSGAVGMTFEQRKKVAEEKAGRPLRVEEVSRLAYSDFIDDIQKSTGFTKDDLDRELRSKGYL